jgi:hypothetical protein
MVATTAYTFLGVSNGGWSAIAAWVGLILAVITVLYAWSQFKEARQTRDEQAQPYVAIYIEPTEADPNAVDLIIKNFGATAARDVSVTIDPPPKSSVNASIDDVKVPSIIRTLVPGQYWSTFWDTTFHREKQGLPAHHTATISFKDSRERQLGPYTFDLDWNQILDRGWIVTHGMHELAGAVREIRDVYRNRGDSQYSHVLAYSGEERDRQQREQWEERRAEHEQVQQQSEQPNPGDAQS